MDLPINTTTTSSPDFITYNSTDWDEHCFIGYLVLDIVNMVVAVVGFPCNLRVLLVLFRGELDPSTSDFFIGSLAVLDSTFCLSNILFTINHQLLNNYIIDIVLYFLFAQYEVGGTCFFCLFPVISFGSLFTFWLCLDGIFIYTIPVQSCLCNPPGGWACVRVQHLFGPPRGCDLPNHLHPLPPSPLPSGADCGHVVSAARLRGLQGGGILRVQ